MDKCLYCGAPIGEETHTCPYCGAVLNSIEEPNVVKSEKVQNAKNTVKTPDPQILTDIVICITIVLVFVVCFLISYNSK